MPKSYQLLTLPEAGRQLGHSRYWIYKRIDAGEIRTCRIGGCLRIAQADLDDYVAKSRNLAKGDKRNTTPRLAAVEVTESTTAS